MRSSITHAALQAFLSGCATMNAFWYPSSITVGILPLIYGLCAWGIWRAFKEAA